MRRAARSSPSAVSKTREIRTQSLTCETLPSYSVLSLYQIRCAFLRLHESATLSSQLAAATLSPRLHSAPAARIAPSYRPLIVSLEPSGWASFVDDVSGSRAISSNAAAAPSL
eukprot:2769463-Prymnesium_polylepis.2